MNHSRSYLSTCLMLLLLSGCSFFGSDAGMIINNQARFETAATNRSIQATSAIQSTNRAVSGYRSTPDSIAGDLSWAFLSLGDLGPGMVSMTWLAPENTFPYGPESGSVSNVQFDLANPLTISGKVLIPSSASDMPERQEIIRAELNFNYVDTTFTLGGQVYTVRTVYTSTFLVEDAAGTMQKGDKLIRLPSESVFKWADITGLHEQRDSAVNGPFQDPTVVNYVHPQEGNQDYIPLTANFPHALPVSWETLADTGKIWTLSFILDNAIVWAEDPVDLLTPQSILEAFRLKFGPNQSTTAGEDDDGIQGILSID